MYLHSISVCWISGEAHIFVTIFIGRYVDLAVWLITFPEISLDFVDVSHHSTRCSALSDQRFSLRYSCFLQIKRLVVGSAVLAVTVSREEILGIIFSSEAIADNLS